MTFIHMSVVTFVGLSMFIRLGSIFPFPILLLSDRREKVPKALSLALLLGRLIGIQRVSIVLNPLYEVEILNFMKFVMKLHDHYECLWATRDHSIFRFDSLFEWSKRYYYGFSFFRW